MTNAAMSVAAPAATKLRTRVNWTPAERSEWLALFDKSGQSVSEFCRANDLAPVTLSLWRSQQQSGAANTEDSGLVEIPMASSPTSLSRNTSTACPCTGRKESVPAVGYGSRARRAAAMWMLRLAVAYAHFKLPRYLLRITKNPHYGDSMERVMYNTVLD
jgi:transposase-like protein